MNLYQYVDSIPQQMIDPFGLAKIKIGNLVLTTPEVKDLAHTHVDPATGLDMGTHLHVSDGSKFFPDVGKFMDKQGRVTNCPAGFSNKFKDAVRAQIKSPNLRNRIFGGGAALGVLAMLASLDSDDEAIQELKQTLASIKSTLVDGNYPSSEDVDRVCIAVGVMYGTIPMLKVREDLETLKPCQTK